MSTATALATGMIEACGRYLRRKTRAFFDVGSQKTFVSKALADELQLQSIGSANMTLTGITGSSPSQPLDQVKLTIKMGNINTDLHALVLNKIPVVVSTPGLATAAATLGSHGIDLADPHVNDVVDDIHILVGADYYFQFVVGHDVRNNVNLLQTSAGYMIAGPIEAQNNINAAIYNVGADQDPSTNNVVDDLTGVTRLWDLENLGIIENEVSVDDHTALDRFNKSIVYDGKQYWVNLPFKENRPCLPDNRGAAYCQMKNLLSKLKKTPTLLDHYDQVIGQLLELDFIEKVGPAPYGKETHHLPHHGVHKESISTPLRVVFNASSKDKGEGDSLNDCLLKGPNLTQKLLDSLLKFRGGRFGYTADISKAFLRVGLKEEDRDFTRFLWKTNPRDIDSQTITYRFKAVLFGATCSPFLLHATLDHHFRTINTEMSELLARSFYVDNLLGSVNDEAELLNIYPEANEILESANMPLQQWVSNSEALRTVVNSEGKEKMLEEVKVLGLNWASLTDTLNLVKPKWGTLPNTKRTLLSEISTTYDPLGLMAPLLIRAKMIMQEAWAAETGWDDPIDIEVKTKWSLLRDELSQVQNITVPRQTHAGSGTLHVFCDASSKAYGAACYITTPNHSHLLTSKCKVAPMKTRSIPQLELTAFLIGARLVKWIIDTFGKIFHPIYLWTDNEACLQWVRNNISEIVYVKNRVAEIRRLKDHYHFHTFHVPTLENPADLLSRGLNHNQLLSNTLWWHGPSWLKGQRGWPQQKDHVAAPLVCMEITCEGGVPPVRLTKFMDEARYGSWSKLLRTTDYVLHFIKVKVNPNMTLNASTYWMRYIQAQHFPLTHDLLAGLTTRPQTNNSQTLIKNLNLYLDRNDIIRSQSRINQAALPKEREDPILLSKHSHATTLYVKHVHEQHKHAGINQTVACVRQQVWIPKLRTFVKQIIKSCHTCIRLHESPLQQPGCPPLPWSRVNFVRPFRDVGIDYSGAITIRDIATGKQRKVYICLITCMASRAVHLELANDNSAITFINLFRRFVSQWSLPNTVITDNAGNFHTTATFLSTLASHPEVKGYFMDHSLQWKFIHPRSPWEGGFYERLVGIVKDGLRLAMYRRVVDYDELVTLLKEVMTRVNNRPLTYLGSDLEDIEAFTPNHLLYGRMINPLPPLTPPEEGDEDYNDREPLISAYEHRSNSLIHFKQIWAEQYLAALRSKHDVIARNTDVPIRINDVVIVEVEGNRESWPLARIVDLPSDSSGVVRSASVLLKGRIQQITLNKLVPLEIREKRRVEESRDRIGMSPALSPSSPQPSNSPPLAHVTPGPAQDESTERLPEEGLDPFRSKERRRAAIKAIERIQQQLQ